MKKNVSFINNQDDVFLDLIHGRTKNILVPLSNLSPDYSGEKIKVSTNFDFDESMKIADYSGTLEDGSGPITTTHNSSIVEYRSGSVYLKKHAHKWKYELDQNNQKLYAYCDNADEKCELSKKIKKKKFLYI